MELISHSECCDTSTAERDLLNIFGGVAYDHDSMPKVVAVHTLTPERLNHQEVGQHDSVLDGLPRNMIGIRIKPKRDLSVQRLFGDLKEQGNEAKISSSCGLEQLTQRDVQHQNTVVTKPVTARVFNKTSSPCNRMLKEHNSGPLCLNYDKNFEEKEPESMSQLCGLLLAGHVNKKEDYHRNSEAVTEVFPVAEKLSLPHGLNGKCTTFSEVSKSINGNLESLHWFNIGMLAEKSPDKPNLHQHVELETDKNSHLYSGKELTASTESNCPKVQATEGFNNDSVQKSHFKTLKEPVSDKFVGSLGVPEDKERYQEASSGTDNTIGKSSLEMCLKGEDKQKQKSDCKIPRKRPRKSIPRKINIDRETMYPSFHSTDSEETLSADEVTSELSPHECTSVVSPNSSAAGSKSPRSTKVIFKRTAGVWSVSSLKSDIKEDTEGTDTWSSNTEFDADRDKQTKKICFFTNRPMAPLVLYDPLDSSNEEHCFSPALDREVRIKELLRKQKELLKEVRQSKATSQNSSLWCTPSTP